MSTFFSFDDNAINFGTTPVDNQFILQYMSIAKGEHVKVYLYGLFHSLYPREEIPIAQMAHDLGMEEADIFSAYRYWERVGLVSRVSDNPPTWQYLSANRRNTIGASLPLDRDYSDFCESLYHVFGSARDLEAKELSLAYEWKADLNLPMEIILMLIHHMIDMRGTNFSFRSAEKVAISLAEANARTIGDAEHLLGREKRIYEGSKKILRHLGKRRDPSEDEQQLFLKWTDEWGYTTDAILAACAETTKGEPTFGYLDGILNGMMQRAGKAMTSAREVSDTRSAEQERRAPLRRLLDTMGLRDVTVNEGTLAVYDDLRQIYPDDIILLAGRQCSKTRGAKLETVEKMLISWKERGFQTQEEVEAYIVSVQQQNQLLKQLCAGWEISYRPSAANRQMIDKWLNTWHYSWETIQARAKEAAAADHPMIYLNALLDPEKPAQGGTRKQVTEQQYDQRSYENDQNRLPDWMVKELGGGEQH